MASESLDVLVENKGKQKTELLPVTIGVKRFRERDGDTTIIPKGLRRTTVDERLDEARRAEVLEARICRQRARVLAPRTRKQRQNA